MYIRKVRRLYTHTQLYTRNTILFIRKKKTNNKSNDNYIYTRAHTASALSETQTRETCTVTPFAACTVRAPAR